MLKSINFVSVAALTLLLTSNAYSHVLCLPNSPEVNIGHQHNQTYTIQRIQPVVQTVVHRAIKPNVNQQKHLQAQRARQQKALANQRRINQQRRLQAQRAQQQDAARKAQIIKQQKLAAQQARAARQQAALQAARNKQQFQTVVRQQPMQPTSHYHVPRPTYSTASVSIQVSAPRVQQHTNQTLHFPGQPLQQSNCHWSCAQ